MLDKNKLTLILYRIYTLKKISVMIQLTAGTNFMNRKALKGSGGGIWVLIQEN